MHQWHDSRFTGLFTFFGRLPLRPHDPAVPMTAGEIPPSSAGGQELGCGGAGWTAEKADLACLGEAIERIDARALPSDVSIVSSWNSWRLDEPAVEPTQWVLFHQQQYASENFPFLPFTPQTACRWVCCREAFTGAAHWVPEELIYLMPRKGERQHYCPGFSTGLSCGKQASLVLLRGVQEVIERDALIGCWWGRYRLEEWPTLTVRDLLGKEQWRRVDRPNLQYRFYHVRSPFSGHVTVVSQCGLDEEGWVFSVGSACRETRLASWQKALLEAIQGRHCVRRLLALHTPGSTPIEVPATFLEHALFYALHPRQLSGTVLEQAVPPSPDSDKDRTEGLEELVARLGPSRPVLFRNLTPPAVKAQSLEWLVLKVVVPGLQPLHGDHRLPFLGGPLWAPRPCKDWASVPPHPFA